MLRNNLQSRLLAVLLGLLVLSACQPEPDIPSARDREALNDWLDSSLTSPKDLISAELQADRSVVFLQEEILRGDTVDLFKALVPIFHDLGVRRLGLFFLDRKDQEKINTYLDGEEGDPQELLFSANASLGYVEYRDFLSYIKAFNQSNQNEAEAIELLGLGSEGEISAEALSTLLESGKDEETRSPVVLWILSRDQAQFPKMDDAEPVLIGHFGPESQGLRWAGLVEELRIQRPIRDGSYAFRPIDPPFTNFGNPSDFDVEIVLVSGFPYRAVEPIEDFVESTTVETALAFFPNFKAQKPRGFAAYRMNRLIRTAARDYQKFLDEVTLEE